MHLERDPPRTRKEQLLTPLEAARIVGVTPNTLEVWRNTGRRPLPFLRRGRRIRYRRGDVLALKRQR
jgi:predicted site-specific integrase-resolvase